MKVIIDIDPELIPAFQKAAATARLQLELLERLNLLDEDGCIHEEALEARGFILPNNDVDWETLRALDSNTSTPSREDD